MTKKFVLESENEISIHVEIDIFCTDQDGADATYEVTSLWSPRHPEGLEESQLSITDLNALERKCQKLADENACEAWREYVIDQADAAADRWKDGD